ncbi:substrate-binding periplasmic protein [Motiliproteus coralliicola]|uniref:substrate-binding periplasmic protein n=1 Tax=Motiliproteus coralliicola TaxID=2283196 RepID=UPI00140263CC|nr:transporter substrate-binding domain-containing protein [Motiliproteus coralliicola]
MSCCTVSADEQESAPYLMVGTFFPYILEESMDGKPQGLAIDVLHRVTELTGDQFKVLVLPWPRALRLVEVGAADGLIGPYKTRQREAILDYSATEIYHDHMIFLSRGKDFKTIRQWRGNLQGIADQRIITVRGWAYGAEFEQIKPRLQTVEANTFSHGLQLLQKGRGELLAANERNAIFEVRKEQLQPKIAYLTPPFGRMVGYFGFSKQKGDHQFQRRFNQALSEMHHNGEMLELWTKHGLKLYPETAPQSLSE